MLVREVGRGESGQKAIISQRNTIEDRPPSWRLRAAMMKIVFD